MLGGAANVAANLQAIGAHPVLVGTCQEDAAGRRLRGLLRTLVDRNNDGLLSIASRATGQVDLSSDELVVLSTPTSDAS